MQVIEEPFEHAGERDANGQCDFYVSGVSYRFLFPGCDFHATRFDDEPGAAGVVCMAKSGENLALDAIPYDDPEFAAAATYLRNTAGADTVKLLLRGGYLPVDFARFPDAWRTNAESLHCFQCRAAIPDGSNTCPNCGWTWM